MRPERPPVNRPGRQAGIRLLVTMSTESYYNSLHIVQPEIRPQNVKLFLREPLVPGLVENHNPSPVRDD